MHRWANFYCNLCHQEMEFLNEHNRGSWLVTETGKVRLDEHCRGDIKRVVRKAKTPATQIQSTEFSFPKDGIEIK